MRRVGRSKRDSIVTPWSRSARCSRSATESSSRNRRRRDRARSVISSPPFFRCDFSLPTNSIRARSTSFARSPRGRVRARSHGGEARSAAAGFRHPRRAIDPVTAKAIEGARELNLIVRAGAQVQTIDVRAASRRGVYVANCPGKNAAAVAELVFGLIIALDRRIVDARSRCAAASGSARSTAKPKASRARRSASRASARSVARSLFARAHSGSSRSRGVARSRRRARKKPA